MSYLPEKELLIAVLDRAALDFHSSNENLKNVAKEWIFDRVGQQSTFSFEWVCIHLDLEPSLLRKKIRNMTIENSISQRQRWLRKKVRNAHLPELDFREAA